jgi:hypothetical protein
MSTNFDELFGQIKLAIESDVSIRSKFQQEFGSVLEMSNTVLKNVREHSPFTMTIQPGNEPESTYLDVSYNKMFLESVRRYPNAQVVIEHDCDSIEPIHITDVHTSIGQYCTCLKKYCAVDFNIKHSCITISADEVQKFEEHNQAFALNDWKLTQRGKLYINMFGVPKCNDDANMPKNLLIVDRKLMKVVKLFENLKDDEMTAFAKFIVNLASK